MNTVNTCLGSDSVAKLMTTIHHLDDNLQQKIKSIFEKYPSVLPVKDSITTVQTGELKIRLKRDEVVYYRPYRLAP